MEIKKTSLNKLHQENKAKFVEFAGYQMPIQYSKGIVEEHKFTRSHSGIFDVSHMGQLFIYGKDDLTKVKSCIKLTGFVNSTDNFVDQPKVINGASDLIASVFGDSGMHTRAAVSTNSLPLGVAVEVDAIFELN